MPTSNHATSVHYCMAKIPKVVDCVLVTCVLCALTGWVRGLYGGVGPTVLKGAVNNCIRFGTFNEMKHMYLQAQGRTGGRYVHSFRLVHIAGSVAKWWPLITPQIFWVVGVQMMRKGASRCIPSSPLA